MPSVAINSGPDFHLLDHIAPLAEMLRVPLITTEEKNWKLAQLYYPQIEHRFMPDMEFRLEEISAEFDTLIECKYFQPHLKWLFKTLFNKEMNLFFCPHGQSDKGYLTPLLAPYALQDLVFVYGPLMLDMLFEQNIQLKNHRIVGNYRLAFYKKHQAFYDKLAADQVKLDFSKKTLLYAPTWNDADQQSSFFTYAKRVIEELPESWNLIIKLHPLIKQRNPAEFFQIIDAVSQKNISLLDEFPPVYPILQLADAYLGDASSVGYDFLFFEKPLYFFPRKGNGRLHQCGKTIDLTQSIYGQIDLDDCYKQEKRKLYTYAFGKQREELTHPLEAKQTVSPDH